MNRKLLRAKGLTCSKLSSQEKKQISDSKKARADAVIFRNLGINSQANLQEKIANAEEQSAVQFRKIREKFCPLK